MPVLHKYCSKEGHYVLAGITGRIVTYRLGTEGVRRLQEIGINDCDKFSWTILLDLIRQGEAYTSCQGTDDEDLSGWTQLGLLFDIAENEPAEADPVPLCACGSMEELHLVHLTDSKTVSMLCDVCRKARRKEIDASVPIYMVTTPTALDRLVERSGFNSDGTVVAYSELLNLNHAAKWKAKERPKRVVVQTGLFAERDDEQHNLL